MGPWSHMIWRLGMNCALWLRKLTHGFFCGGHQFLTIKRFYKKSESTVAEGTILDPKFCGGRHDDHGGLRLHVMQLELNIETAHGSRQADIEDGQCHGMALGIIEKGFRVMEGLGAQARDKKEPPDGFEDRYIIIQHTDGSM